MSRRAASIVVWSLWAVETAVVGAVLVGLVLDPGTSDGLSSEIAGSMFILVFATTGALVASRLPINPVGWLMCLCALAFTIGGVSGRITEHALREDLDNPVVTLAAWVGSFVWAIGAGPAATFLLLLFPDGRLPSDRWRPVAWLAGTGLALAVIGLAVKPVRIEGTGVSNPLGIPGTEQVLNLVVGVGLAMLFVSILASCMSLIVRYRAAGHEQRQQIKWVAYSVPVVVVWLAASIWVESTQSGETAVEIANTLTATGLMVVPVTMGIAILRHRLYDIDVVINRTLVYGSLTVTLAVAYLGLVLLLQLALGPLTEQSDLAVAGSTLAVAALFRPARRRIQEIVDRRFYRSRYDAARTLDVFAGRLRNEVDLEAVGADLRATVSDAVQPAHVSLWLRSTR